MNYEKLTVDRFASNLKDGKYETLTGARRAIGKTSSWSAKEKEKAHEFANKHFGETDAKPATKSAKTPKAAAKSAKVQKGAAKKQARVAAKKTSAKASKVEDREEVLEESSTPRTPQRRPSISATSGEIHLSDAVNMGHQMLSFFSEAKQNYEFQKNVNPSGDYSKALAAMNEGFTRAVTFVANHIPQVEGIDTTLPPARVSLPKESPKPQQVAPRPQTAALTTTQGTFEEPLTPEEQKMAADLRNATPASTIAALPRPVAPQS